MISYVSTLWIGLVLGSIIATVAKFRVESLNYAVALDVGRVTFNWIYVAEGILLGFLIIGYFLSGRKQVILSLAVIVLIVLVVVQIGVLKPILDERVLAVLNGVELAASNVHRVYGGLELTKVLLLVFLSIRSFD